MFLLGQHQRTRKPPACGGVAGGPSGHARLYARDIHTGNSRTLYFAFFQTYLERQYPVNWRATMSQSWATLRYSGLSFRSAWASDLQFEF